MVVPDEETSDVGSPVSVKVELMVETLLRSRPENPEFIWQERVDGVLRTAATAEARLFGAEQ
jgi:hypothetical protein